MHKSRTGMFNPPGPPANIIAETRLGKIFHHEDAKAQSAKVDLCAFATLWKSLVKPLDPSR